MQANKNLPVVKIWFEDFWDGFDKYNNCFTLVLRKHFKLEFDRRDPDYIFCSVFGQSAMRYKGIRIMFVGENMTADFNKYDYIIGFDYIQYSDRYLRIPMKDFYNDWENVVKKHEHVDMKKFLNRDFCCRVVTNGGCIFREAFYEKINRKKYVASGGKYKNNLPQQLPVVNKKQFLEGYKFNIAFENSAYPGYCTEKIYDAWAAGCIPIYWGDSTITNWCNEASFINCHKFKTIDETIEYILDLERDVGRIEKMLKTPVFKHEESSENELEQFLLNIFLQAGKKAYRRNSYFSLVIPEEGVHANLLYVGEEDVKNQEGLVMGQDQVYSVLDGLIREEIDRGQTIGIYPFGRNGILAKNLLVERYGRTDAILLDNDLAQYNKDIMSIKDFEKVDNSNITIILCTSNPYLNKTLLESLKQRKLKAQVRNVLDIEHVILQRPEKVEYFRLIKNLCRVKKAINHELVRVGGKNDGGYIMLNDFKDIKTVYSFGIGGDISWEETVAGYTDELNVYCYDHTIESLPKENARMHFYKIGIAGEDAKEDDLLSMDSILTENNHQKEEMILKMDVEGAEWDFLNSVSQDTLKKFVQITLELHNLTDNNDGVRIIAALKKINKTHQAIWVHANNNCGGERAGNIVIPTCLEITFASRKKYEFVPISYSGPLPIDNPNIEEYPDIELKNWGDIPEK